MSNGIFSIDSVGTDIALGIGFYIVEFAISAAFLYFAARRVPGLASIVERLRRRPLAEHLVDYIKQNRAEWGDLLAQRLAQDYGTLSTRSALPVRAVRLSPHAGRRSQSTRSVDFVSSLTRKPRTYVLFGDAGQGKTTALLLTAYRMCRSRRAILEGTRAIPTILAVSDLRHEVVELLARQQGGPGLLRQVFRLLLARQVLNCISGDPEIASELDIDRLLTASARAVGNWALPDFRERVDGALADAKYRIRKSGKKIQLFVDAFDEIENFESLSLAPDISNALQAALWDFIRTWRGVAWCIVTSRPSHKEFLSLPDIPHYAIGWTNAEEIIDFAKALRRQGVEEIDLKELAGDRHRVHAVFRHALNDRRLYLASLLRFWTKLDLPATPESPLASNQDAMYALMHRILMHARQDSLLQNQKVTSVPHLRSASQQCGALREFAVRAFTDPAISGHDLDALALHWGIDANCLHTFLIAASGGRADHLARHLPIRDAGAYEFVHTDHRDFWAADALLECWRQGRILPGGAPLEFLKIVLAHPSVMAFLAEGFRAAEDRLQVRETVFETLAREVYARQGQRAGSSGRDPTVAAAALSIIARLCVYDQTPLSVWISVPVVDTCFQGAQLRGLSLDECTFLGCNFADARMQGTSLNRAILHGCDFDNAELRGANFQGARLSGADFTNAAFGHYATRESSGTKSLVMGLEPTAGAPTRFAGADLRGARFFNVRVTLYGFLNAWAAIKVSPYQLLVATSLGLFSVSARNGKWGTGYVEQVYFGDHPDALMDVDFHDRTCHMVCAARDRKVHYGHVCNDEAFSTATEIPRFSELGRGISTGDQYPRRARLSRSGRYIAVGVRDGWVSFHSAERVRSAKLYPHQSGAQYLEHEGPVVAVERFMEYEYADAFITAGYDGCVWRWWLEDGSAEWKRLRLWSLAAATSRKQDIVRSVAIAEKGPCRGWLLIGVESNARAHGLYAAPYSANTEQVGSHNQKPLIALPAAVFSLCLNRAADRVFLGLADGRIAMISLSMHAGMPVAKCMHLYGAPDDDIVRSIVLLDDATVASISWMGRLELYFIRNQKLLHQTTLVLQDVPAVRERLKRGRECDIKEICVAQGSEFSAARGLPSAKAEYLNRLICE
jgi:hypothetical protein